MKIILLEDVKNVGKKGQIIEANPGYARNYLLPKKLGVEANSQNLNNLKLQKANEEKIAREQLEAAREFAKELETKEVVVNLCGGENGKVFGSVSTKEIAQAAQEQCGMTIDKKKIQLAEPIKSFGVYETTVRLHPQVSGKLKVVVREAK